MEQNKQDKASFQQGQQGSGSAENRGQERSAQKNKSGTDIPLDDMGDDQQRIVGLHDLGAVSGRDDLSGGSGDRMENQSTDQPTER